MRKRPVQQRSQRLVDALVEAAGQVVAEHGLNALTTVRVAERAGVSVGSLYQYFQNKDALLAALVDRMNRELGQAVHAAAPTLIDADPRTLVRGLLDTAFVFIGGRKGLHQELLRHWHRLDIEQGLRRFEQQMMELIRAYALVHLRDLKLDPTPAQGFILINSVVFTLLRYLSLPRAPLFSREQLVEELTQLVTAGLHAGTTPSTRTSRRAAKRPAL